MELLFGFVAFIALVVAWAFIPSEPEHEYVENMRTVSAVS